MHASIIVRISSLANGPLQIAINFTVILFVIQILELCLFVCFKLAKIHNLIIFSVYFMQFLQGKILVKISMKALEKVADSVLALTVPDERTIPITVGQLSMTLGRYSIQRLSGLEIKAGKGQFILPSNGQLLLSGVNITSFVDVQVGIHALQENFNPSFISADTDPSQVKVTHWVP